MTIRRAPLADAGPVPCEYCGYPFFDDIDEGLPFWLFQDSAPFDILDGPFCGRRCARLHGERKAKVPA